MPDPGKTIFLSYARDDADAVRRLAEALRSAGIEVWFDQNELRGGDAWDAKLRGQIRMCTLFMPVISATTQARGEGYFRREWKLAVDRTQDMAAGIPFIVPVAIDETRESEALVPEEFMRVQWTRLPGGVATPEFVAQVKRLLEGRSLGGGLGGMGVPPMSGNQGRGRDDRAAANPQTHGRPAHATQTHGQDARATRRRSLPVWPFAAAGAVILAGGSAFLVLRPREKPPAMPPSASAPALTPATATPTSISPARQLAARVWTIWEKQDDATRDDWVLAEQLAQRAVGLDPEDGDVSAAQAQVSLAFIVYGFDNSPARYETARTQAQRAVRLAPDSVETQFALANFYRRLPATREEGVKTLRQLVERAPTDKRILRVLASALRAQGRNEESLVFSDRAIALPGGDPVAMFGKEEALRYLGRIAEGESILDQVLAVRPTPAAQLKKLYYVLNIHGDLEQARSLVEKMPASVLLDEWGAAQASQVWLWRREPRRVLAMLNAVPKDFLEKGNLFTGPKGYATGMAHQMAGNADAARADWQVALEVVERRLKEQPNSIDLVGWKTLLLGRLGQRPEGEAALRVYEQLVSTTPNFSRVTTLAMAFALLGRVEEGTELLMKIQAQPWVSLRYNPGYDHFRGHPKFDAWLKQTPR